MTQQYNTSNIKIKTAVLVFLKNLSAPLVLYFDNPQEIYNELNLRSCTSGRTILCINYEKTP